MNYQEVMERLEDAKTRGSIPGLESIRELLKRLNQPQENMQYVHIAGTNGKGSVAAYLSNMLWKEGIPTGRFTSPALSDVWEKIAYNDKMISRRMVAKGMTLILQASDDMEAKGFRPPTVFEMETALALWYFSKKKCKIAVLECGMGGLLDSTNIIGNTAVCVLTSISMDHCEYLGDTLESIAKQKAGIIKEGCRTVSALQSPEAERVIREVCEQKHATLTIANPDEITQLKTNRQFQIFNYKEWEKVTISLAGAFQPQNAILAIQARVALQQCGYPIFAPTMYAALKETTWFGRFTCICDKPTVIVDGAHNEDAAQKLAKSIRFYFTNRKIVFIMGVLKDKEYDKIIRHVCDIPTTVITVTPPIPERALPAMELAKEWCHYHASVSAADSIPEAVELAMLMAGSDGVVISFGSLSFLSQIKEAVSRSNADNRRKI